MNKRKITYQLIFWIAFFLYNMFYELKYSDLIQALIDSTLTTAIIGILVYLNTLWLLPNYFYKKQYLKYVLIFGGFSVLFVLVSFYLSDNFLTDNNILFFDFLMVGGISSAWVMMDQIRTKEKLAQIEKEQVNAQLKFLKAQTNPHFLFNVLNNIHFLIAKDPEKASETLIKLSDLLRYQLYETNTELVTIEKEIEQLKSYIELEKIRIGDKLELNVHFNYTDGNITIAPFLLLPLIENAFKHGNGTDKGFILFYLEVTDTEVDLKVENSLAEIGEQSESGGLGIANLEDRLKLLYPEKHSFKYGVEKDKYVAHLRIFHKTL